MIRIRRGTGVAWTIGSDHPRRLLLLVGVVVLSLIGGAAAYTLGVSPVLRESRSGQASLAAQQERWTFASPTLGRQMPILALLPPGYESSAKRYPVLYMLHGLGGTLEEWTSYGLFGVAESLMSKGSVRPFIIILPEGEDGYWVDHANGGPQWGGYLARDVVEEVDSRFRTIPDAAHRAVGGLSMGADGSLQIALNNPDVFGVVGVHSPVLRSYEDSLPYYGDRQYFEAHSPEGLARQRPDVARKLAIWLDVGLTDDWLDRATALHDELTSLGIEHTWLTGKGAHDGYYWGEQAPEYLRFYGSAFGK